MTRIAYQSFAACAALFLTIGTIGAIVTTPAARAMTVVPVLA